jgi:hypothetical protein
MKEEKLFFALPSDSEGGRRKLAFFALFLTFAPPEAGLGKRRNSHDFQGLFGLSSGYFRSNN